MQITFNLEDFEMYIPAGRIGNLKKALKWEEIEYTVADKNAVFDTVLKTDFKFAPSYTAESILTANTKNFEKNKGERAYLMSQFANAALPSAASKLKFKFNFEIGEMAENLIIDAKLLSKKEKLAKLKQLNKEI